MGEMAFQRDKYLAKVIPTTSKLGILNVSTPVWMTPVLIESNSRLHGQGAS